MKDPTLLLKIYLEEKVTIRLRDSQIITGTLHAFDEHMNLILSDTNLNDKKLLLIRGESVTFVAQS